MSKRVQQYKGPVTHQAVSIYDLIPHEANYNVHPQEQLEDLKASLRRYGQVEDTVVKALPDGKYKIVAHEGVTTAALQLLEAKECQHLAQWNVTIVPDIWSDLDVKGYMVTSNETTRKSSPDETLLVQLLQEQADAGFDLASLGSDEESLRQMLEGLGDAYLGEREQEREREEGEIPEQVETRARIGDIWQLGRHRIGVFDCHDKGLMKKFLGNKAVDAVVSDPPYGMKLDTSYSFSKGNEAMSIKPTRGYAKVVGDDKDYDASFIFSSFPNAKEVFLFGADYYVDTLPNYGKSGSWMVWDKKNEALRNILGLADFELIWSKQRHKRRVYAILWNGALGTESEDTKRRVHPTQKPVRLIEAIMGEYTKPDMLVIDPYLGSGSTLIACEHLGNSCYGVEIDPHYASISISRWEKHTGQIATLLERSEAEHA